MTPEIPFSILEVKIYDKITQQRIQDLMLISCEYDNKINYDDVIKVFAGYSTVLSKLIVW